jgi:hypothetical protein
VLSVGCGAPVRYHFSPARAHDSRHLTIDEAWRGCGLLADLAYASLARLRACNAHGVVFVIRLKDNGKPKVDDVARGQVTQEFFPETDFDALLEAETLLLDGRAIDADVHVGTGKKRVQVRLVGGNTAKGYGLFLTNLPPRTGPRQVTDIYRVRWEVELSIRVDKSVPRLAHVDAERPCSGKTLLQASLLASIITALLAHTQNRQTRPPQDGMPRTEAPLHPRRLAWPLAVSCQSIAQARDLQGAAAQQRWQQIAELLVHSGRDPNGRRRPSVLDQLRGWNRQPVVRTQTRRGNLRQRLQWTPMVARPCPSCLLPPAHLAQAQPPDQVAGERRPCRNLGVKAQPAHRRLQGSLKWTNMVHDHLNSWFAHF